jgi:opacity protein-like surface antigen
MRKLLLTATAIVFSSVTSNANDVVIIPNTPNEGDFTTVTTVTTGNPVTTNNLISQDWIDGTWNGTMFPDSSDINENTWLTGKDGKYAETTLNSEDYVSIEELKLGFTSNFTANIRWWNNVESTVTMTQSVTNGIDTTTQSTTFEDTTNSSYQVNPYGNTLIMNPDPDMTHGTATYRFDFDIQGNKNYNGGHAGVDVRDPSARIDYTALSSTTVSEITYCWQQTPPTCPGQDEIEAVEEIINDLDTIIADFILPEEIIEYDVVPIDIEYSFNDVFEDEIEIEEYEPVVLMDEFFFEDDYFEPDYYEDVVMEDFIPEDIVMVETLDWNDSNVVFDELPSLEMFEELPPLEEVYMEDIVMEEMFAEEFTEEMQEEFIEEVFEEFVMETEPEPMPDPEPEPIEEIQEVAMVQEEPEPIEEQPAMEEIQEEPEPIQEEIVDEQIEEQPSSEEVVADEPEPTTEVAEQEEAIEEPIEAEPTAVAETTEPKSNESVEVDLDIKVAAIEKAIQAKVANEMQRVSLTLDVINEVVSREMTDKQADISSYFNTNAALFDTRQLPSGDPAFFMQVSLASYDKTIYASQPSIAGTDPVVKHQIKMQEYKKNTSDAYRNLMELLNARNIQ